MLILHFDYVSASAAVAVLRLQRVADTGAPVRFSGVDTLGLDMTVPATLEQLEEYTLWREEATRLGLPMRRPQRRPPTLRAHLIGDLADEMELGAAWRSACLRAFWVEGEDLGDVGVVLALAERAGIERDAAAARLDDAREVASARERALATHRRGVGGVPVLEVDGTFMSAHLEQPVLQQLALL